MKVDTSFGSCDDGCMSRKISVEWELQTRDCFSVIVLWVDIFFRDILLSSSLDTAERLRDEMDFNLKSSSHRENGEG